MVFSSASELQSARTGGFGQRLDAAMEPESGTVERDRLDAQTLCLFGDALAHLLGGSLVAAGLAVFAHVGLERRRAGKHLVAFGRDDLRVDVAIRAADHQPRRTLLGNAHPGFAGAAATSLFLVHTSSSKSENLLLLGLFDHNALVDIAHALALVRLGRAVGADFRRDLADGLLVDALDDDFRLRWRLDLHALRHCVDDRMRESQRQVDLVARGLRAITDANQRQLALVAVGDALDHVGDERAQRALHRARFRRLRLEYELLTVLTVGNAIDCYCRAELAREGAQRTLDGDFAPGRRHFDFGR